MRAVGRKHLPNVQFDNVTCDDIFILSLTYDNMLDKT